MTLDDVRRAGAATPRWDGSTAPIALGETNVSLAAGHQESVVLKVDEPPELRRVPLEGTLIGPEEWELAKLVLRFELIGTPLGGGSGSFTIPRSRMQAVNRRELRRKRPGLQAG